ncbi:hypothetical protein [Mesorhizobium waimense]|uniref:hypothetical protein n=1 Tax=Mesorhizobium waimense TaxID=1300307 RepID=UPI001FE1D749|nr:hypothetical protein [Mesorhizobium waimense]
MTCHPPGFLVDEHYIALESDLVAGLCLRVDDRTGMIERRNVKHGAIVDALSHRGSDRHLVADIDFPRQGNRILAPRIW